MDIKSGLMFLKVLEVEQSHKVEAGLHCKGHRSGESEATKGSNLAASAAATKRDTITRASPVTINATFPLCELISSGKLP